MTVAVSEGSTPAGARRLPAPHRAGAGTARTAASTLGRLGQPTASRATGDVPSRPERALFARLARDRDVATRDALMRQFLPLSRQLARRYGGGQDRDDLEQVAAIGLLMAIDRFDPNRGVTFSTFAVPTILGELKRHLRDNGWSVHVPRSVQELAIRVERVSVELVGELGRAPTVAELTVRVGASTERVEEAVHAATARFAVSLDQPWPDADEETPALHELATTDPGFEIVDDAERLDGLMRALSARDRLILELRFRDDRQQAKIADIVGISQMQVSRLIRRAIDQLHIAAA
jgi:RNA polymerase sigma-B factor